MNLTPEESAAVLVEEFATLVKEEVAATLQKDMPVVISYLQKAEKAKPGFLGIRADLDGTLVDICQAALTWANSINPPASIEAPAAPSSEESK